MKLNKISSIFNGKKFMNTNVAIFGTALTAMFMMPVHAEEAQAAADTEEMEIIEVTGMAGSMKAATRLKRTDGRIVDAIVAEDIGKLPDNNIAEALQRITGVSITTDFGVGDGVSIRGLPQNRVELNGRSTIGDSRDGISLQDFPSSFLKTVEVVKSPTADMIEGALGGTVSMRTVRPLELDGFTSAVSIDGEYSDKTENWAPVINTTMGQNWDLGDNGSFGAIAMIAYQDREIRQDQFMSRVLPQDIDVNGMTANTNSGNFIVRDQHTVEQYVEDRERTAMSLQLQWAPASGDGMVYLDLSATKREGEQHGNSILGVVGSLETNANTTQDSNGQLDNYTLVNDFAIPKTYSDFRETDSESHALGGEYYLTDKIKLSGEISYASSDSDRPDSEFTLRPIEKAPWLVDESLVTHVYDGQFSQDGDELPSIIHSDPNAYIAAENLALRTFKSELKNTDNEETAVRFDVEFDEPLDIDWLSKVKTGVRATKRDYEYEEYKEEIKDIYKNASFADGSSGALWIDDYNAAFADSFTTLSHSNSFDQSGKTGQNDLLRFASFNGLSNPGRAYGELQQLLAGTNLATTGSLRDNQDFNEGAYRDISEDTIAVYLSAYLDFGDLTAIVGGRYIETDLESAVMRDGEKVNGENDYSDFLPSLNVSYALNQDTILRFAAAKVMRRADFSELSPAFDVNNDLTKATQGSIDLDPYRATQYDLSLEHYFGTGNMVSFAVFYKDVESFLTNSSTCVADPTTSGQNVTEWYSVCQLESAGSDNSQMVYASTNTYSDAEGFALVDGLRANGLTGIDTQKDTNGEEGEVKGFEVGYQQFFDFLPGAWSGLGVNLNYTYADSEQPNGNPLLDISENTYNIQAFWEYEGFALRAAYNYRDEYLDTENEKRVIGINSDGSIGDEDSIYGNNYRDDRGQLDLSASWDINESVTVIANGTNVLGEPSVFLSELGSPWKMTEADSRYSLGIRAKF